jgi:hypothetical protein
MKTNKLNVILTTVAISGIVLLATTKGTASFLSAMAMTVSYIAIAILVALAVLDYRVGSKNYSAR